MPFSSSTTTSAHHGSSTIALFRNRLPESRLGHECSTYREFCDRFHHQNSVPIAHRKDYSLVVVTDTARQRILLGHKHRGFGAGFYNSFGGKVDNAIDKSPLHSAQRELQEETGIVAPLSAVFPVGKLNFTFCDSDTEMAVHLFRVHVSYNDKNNYSNDDGEKPEERIKDIILLGNGNDVNLQGCTDEITPYWFDDWHDIPLHTMFADDSVWLTTLLSSSSTKPNLQFNGWFHFQGGGTETNTILHYYIEEQAQEI